MAEKHSVGTLHFTDRRFIELGDAPLQSPFSSLPLAHTINLFVIPHYCPIAAPIHLAIIIISSRSVQSKVLLLGHDEMELINCTNFQSFVDSNHICTDSKGRTNASHFFSLARAIILRLHRFFTSNWTCASSKSVPFGRIVIACQINLMHSTHTNSRRRKPQTQTAGATRFIHFGPPLSSWLHLTMM